jgi:ectoine hydroxylase
MAETRLTDTQLAQFNDDGYLVLPGLFDAEEIDLLTKVSKGDTVLASETRGNMDLEGQRTRLALRNHLSDDMYSAIVRSHRVVDPMEQMLGGEVYHYHHKMNMKEPLVGGAWEWHQDYGYWYNNGCLFPYMASCFIAVDPCTKENGCLQVIKGSHHMGRIDHGQVAGQTGADLERVEKCLERLELVYCEMRPGDALFFHSNLLHRSDTNRSPHPRWSLICCYNAARNNPYKEHHHPCYSYLEKWPDEKVKEVGRRQWEAMQAAV